MSVVSAVQKGDPGRGSYIIRYAAQQAARLEHTAGGALGSEQKLPRIKMTVKMRHRLSCQLRKSHTRADPDSIKNLQRGDAVSLSMDLQCTRGGSQVGCKSKVCLAERVEQASASGS